MATEAVMLSVERFIKAPPLLVWEAWSTPAHLEKWWIPAPIECKVIKLDLRPGGGFETRMREDGGDFKPHVEGCFLEAVPEKRLVWTTALSEGWQPCDPWLALTAILTLEAEDGGTRYRARVLHKSAAEAQRHEALGFYEGWGTIIAQLAAFAEQRS